jgi:lipopolysaccharide transport system ATP-binding protein
MNWTIQIENVGKKYRKGGVRHFNSNFREAINRKVAKAFSSLNILQKKSKPLSNSSFEEFWAVRNINLEVLEGEVVGIIGRNGAGKSTLLKVLSRITSPSVGSIRYRGRLASLLEVGTGFHGDLTGRENIILNGGILGMRRAEILSKVDPITEFSEVGSFLDTPVKYYSSGMYLRLAFAVAAHLEPEILVVDEVLAVGDAGFQKKCIGKMNDVARSGRTILFVSHNMGAIAQLCNRVVLLNKGEIHAQGSVSDVLSAYSQLNFNNDPTPTIPKNPSIDCALQSINIYDGKGNKSMSFDIADEIIFKLVYEVRRKLDGMQLSLTLERNMVEIIHTFDTDHLLDIPSKDNGTYEAILRFPKMFLKAGTYIVHITCGTPDRLIQNLESVVSFEIEEISQNNHMRGFRKDRCGHIISPGKWETNKIN